MTTSSNLNDQLNQYIKEYRVDGIFLDANVLLLLLISEFDVTFVGGKRLEKYSGLDAQLLRGFTGEFSRILTSAPILIEVSNLVGNMLSGRKKREFFDQMLPIFDSTNSASICHCSVHGIKLVPETFSRLGFTDASIITIALDKHFLLTDDLDLYLDAQNKGISAINFTHMREAADLL
jgi:hypothetical protein